jgi:HEAT repeat protein
MKEQKGNWLSRLFSGRKEEVHRASEVTVMSRIVKLRGRGEGPPVIHPLLKDIHDNSSGVRVAAATGLGSVSQPWAVSALIEQLDDDCREVREAAARSLARIGDSSAKAGLTGLLVDPDGAIRLVASQALAQLGDLRWKDLILGEEADLIRLTKSEHGVELLAKVSRDCSVRLRKQALAVLAGVNTPFAITLLSEAVADPNEGIRDQAIESLAKIGGTEVFGALAEAAKDDRRDFRRASAAIALGRIGFEQAWSDLLPAANAEDKIVRDAAQNALALLMLKHSRCFDQAAELVGRQGNPSERALACHLFGLMKNSRSVAPLIHALSDTESEVRRTATSLLRSLGKGLTLEPLLQALKEKTNSSRRVAVVGLLESIDDQRAASALLVAAEDEDLAVREAGAAAVTRLGLQKRREKGITEPLPRGASSAAGQPDAIPQREEDRTADPVRKIGQYEIVCELDRGAFGAVYKAHDTHLDQVVAIKHLLAADPQVLRDEAGVLSELRHENIVGFRHLFPERGQWYMVMDFVGGGSLAKWVRDGRLYEGDRNAALERILAFSIQFAEGLGFAHSKKVVHQDVKPANVLIDAAGVAKVSDFGLAKARAQAQRQQLPVGQQSILVSAGGMTPAYCSPEQHGREPLTARTDVWSWAVSVLEMFTGGVSWQHGTAAPAVLEEYLQHGVGDHPGIPPMPEAVARLLKNCFAQKPQARPQMRDVAAGLKAIYG